VSPGDSVNVLFQMRAPSPTRLLELGTLLLNWSTHATDGAGAAGAGAGAGSDSEGDGFVQRIAVPPLVVTPADFDAHLCMLCVFVCCAVLYSDGLSGCVRVCVHSQLTLVTPHSMSVTSSSRSAVRCQCVDCQPHITDSCSVRHCCGE